MSEGTDDHSLLADGFEDAFLGWAPRMNSPTLAVYDYEKCIEILMNRDGMSRDDAEEYFGFNVEDAWAGEGTPLFLHRDTIEGFNGLLENCRD
jgi:hypothetical protein